MKLLLSLILISIAGLSNGQEYFQQEVNTSIKVRLNDKNHTLSAFEQIEYINHSPDSLPHIFMHLWPNAYLNNQTAMGKQNDANGEVDFHFADSIDRGFIDSLDFKINGETAHVAYDVDHVDIVALILSTPLPPGEKLTITTPFRVKIPKGTYSRLGHIGESYQITQWFPKPAVYDKNGWHPIPYLSQGEFFSEYGSYDVEITVPENYVVGATGDLVNGEEAQNFLDRKAEETKSHFENNSIPSYNKAGYPDMSFPKSATAYKTLHFYQENIHDFAWFADKRYHVLKGEVKLPHSGRTVTTWAMFTNNEANLWKKSIEYLNDAIYYYSLWNGDYPYEQVTAVDGSISAGGGMEYPNITVIGESYTDLALEQVIVHEVGHNWFYGILGSNERKHAWMDEGLNTFTENRYQEVKYPSLQGDALGLPSKLNKKLGLDVYGSRGVYDLGYLFNARRNYDQPIETSSEDFTSTNYGAIVYGKTAIGLDYLLAYLGDSLFDQCMHKYFDTWKFKHPYPEDLRTIFEDQTKKDLSWFFEDYIKTSKKIDYAISGLKKKDNGYTLKIKNKAGIAGPFSITSLKGDSVIQQTWYEGVTDKNQIEFTTPPANKIILDYNMDIPELDRTDDGIRTKGLFKKIENPKLEFLGSIESRDKTSLYYTPLIGYNTIDKFMPGIALYNHTFPQKKLEWLVIPMYSSGRKSLSGTGFVHYNLHLSKIFRKVEFGVSGEVFGINRIDNSYYPNYIITEQKERRDKYEFSIDMEVMQPLRSKTKHEIKLRRIAINEIPSTLNSTSVFGIASYKISNRQFLKPANIQLDYIYGNPTLANSFSQIAINANLRLNYNSRLDGIDFRFFGGYAITANDNSRYSFHLAGQNGFNDYLYDHTFIGRSDNSPSFWAQQINPNQGGFKAFSSIASNSWLIASNVKAELPIGPFGIYSDFGLYPFLNNTNGIFEERTGIAYDAGIYLPLAKNKIEVYVPLMYATDIKNEITYAGLSFWQQIRFTFHIQQLNPFKMIKEINP